MESLDMASPTQLVQLRGQIRHRLTANQAEQHGRTFEVVTHLLELDPEQHTDDLLRPLVEYGLVAGEDHRKLETFTILTKLKPSKSEIERSRRSVAEFEEQISEKLDW